MTKNQLTRRIMRRTYYAYAIHMMTRPLVRLGVLFIALTFVVAKLVFVAAVFANAQSVGLAKLPEFTLSAFLNADSLTLVSALALLLVVISVVRHMALIPFSPNRQYA